MTFPIKLLIADDHPFIRLGVRNALMAEPDMVIVGEAANGDEVIQLCSRLDVDILILDIGMPGLPCKQVIMQMTAILPGAKIVIFSAHAEEAHIRGLLPLGISGYLVKDEAIDELPHAIRSVAAGGQWFSARILTKVTQLIGEETSHSNGFLCSRRETDVIRLLGCGMTNERIGIELCISTRTVRFHVENLMAKFGAQNRTEAVVIAKQLGII
jgi:DNA-binding NarL/FixJ family response regulator